MCYLLPAVVWGSTSRFLTPSYIFGHTPAKSHHFETEICLTKPRCSFLSLKCCCGVTRRSLFRGWMCLPSLLSCTLVAHIPTSECKKGWSAPHWSCSCAHPSCPSAHKKPRWLQRELVQVPRKTEAFICLLSCRGRSGERQYGHAWLNTPLGCREVFGLSKERFLSLSWAAWEPLLSNRLMCGACRSKVHPFLQWKHTSGLRLVKKLKIALLILCP